MKERSELEAKRVSTTLVETDKRPTRPMRPVPDILEVENTKQWVEFWRRQVEEYQDIENRQALRGWAGIAERYHSKGERIKLHIENAREQIGPTEIQLR